MNTSENYKLYIDDRGAFILANHAGHCFLGYEPRDAAENLAYFSDIKSAGVCLDDYGYGFRPETYICPVDFANMRGCDIVSAISDASDRIANLNLRRASWSAEQARTLNFYLKAEICSDNISLTPINAEYLSYLVNGDASGLTDDEAAEAVIIDKRLEVVEVCPDGHDMNGEIPCLVRYKVSDAEAVKL